MCQALCKALGTQWSAESDMGSSSRGKGPPTKEKTYINKCKMAAVMRQGPT